MDFLTDMAAFLYSIIHMVAQLASREWPPVGIVTIFGKIALEYRRMQKSGFRPVQADDSALIRSYSP